MLPAKRRHAGAQTGRITVQLNTRIGKQLQLTAAHFDAFVVLAGGAGNELRFAIDERLPERHTLVGIEAPG